MNNNEILDQYKQQLVLSKSEHTVAAYCGDVRLFFRYLESVGVKRVSSIKPVHINKYLATQLQENKSSSTVSRYSLSIKSFFRFLRRTRRVVEDVMDEVIIPRIKKTLPYVPSIEEIEKILSSPNQETCCGVRDRAILEVLYSSGLRATELCALRVEDVTEKSITIRCGKGNKGRTIPITSTAWNWIQQYLDGHTGDDFLFVTSMGNPLTRQFLGDIIRRHATRAGVKKVTPHTIRHACATHLLSSGADIRMIQAVLGHASIASTQRYTHLTSVNIDTMFKKFHPSEK